ncbi:MAG TPA: GNAT family protein [Flavobacteriales bacterium]|nr:GNAT family protein [Flavobacteriales bacterium]HRE97796.1 GNAT family protein [Flavobacteriales bacterium]HRJ35157.1 GNAT family protein [Flavobacteriales bacterium]HRJ37143.1 GNAT family protein [Flavobacteriales bacterium]
MNPLYTQRLIIRPVEREDIPALFAYRSDPEVSRYLQRDYHSVDDVKYLVDETSRVADVPGTWFQLVVLAKDEGMIIGDIGIHFPAGDAQQSQVEIGYTFAKQHQGKGFAREAVSAVVEFIFAELNKRRITAGLDPENRASERLLQRIGFVKEAHFRKSYYCKGEWVDDVIYALLKEEWKPGENR